MNSFLHHHWSVFGQNTLIFADQLNPHTATDSPQVVAVASLVDDLLCLSYFIEQTHWLKLPPFNHLQRRDYLWENHCLECFLSGATADYFEINYSPDGAYNLYKFTDYRTPNAMPPKQAQGTLTPKTASLMNNFHIVQFGVQFDEPLSIHLIHPCVILYQNDTPLFYTKTHAPTPDFHDKRHWQPMNKN